MSPPSDFLREVWIRQFLTMAGHTVLTYDYLLTLDLEVDYIWYTPWSTVKAVFLLNRYGTLIGQSFLALEELGILSHGSRKFCANFLWCQSLLTLFLSETTRTLLLLRAWALWRWSYRVAISLVSVYVCYVLMRSAYSSYIVFKYDAKFHFPYLGETGVCVTSANVGSVWLTDVTSFLLDTGMFAMIAYYLYKLCRGWKHLRRWPLLRLLVRDAILFYMVNVFHDVLGILSLSLFEGDPLYFVQVAFSYPLLIVTGQRVVLNLRGFQSKAYTTEDMNHTVDRQIAAMRQLPWWQSVDIWMNDLHQELELSEERTGHRMVRTAGMRIMEHGNSYELELEVIRTPCSPKTHTRGFTV